MADFLGADASLRALAKGCPFCGEDKLQEKDQGQNDGESDGPFFLLPRNAFAEVDHHDDEDEQDHDRPGIDDDLDDGHERGAKQAEQAAQADEGENQIKGAISLVLGEDHPQDGADTNGG